LNLQNLIVLAPANASLCEARVPITSRYSETRSVGLAVAG
jgi:hypothetical protein